MENDKTRNNETENHRQSLFSLFAETEFDFY